MLPEELLARRANAWDAYWQHQPLRRFSQPTGPDMQLYRRLSYGRLAEISVLDTRQYRNDQACGDGTDPVPCGDLDDTSRTITGDAREQWFVSGLARSRPSHQAAMSSSGPIVAAALAAVSPLREKAMRSSPASAPGTRVRSAARRFRSAWSRGAPSSHLMVPA
jgi:phosphodiesterase/alkaline phosphatase D-like protein